MVFRKQPVRRESAEWKNVAWHPSSSSVSPASEFPSMSRSALPFPASVDTANRRLALSRACVKAPHNVRGRPLADGMVAEIACPAPFSSAFSATSENP